MEKPDGVDIAALLEVAHSRGFQLITQRIREIHAAKMRELRNSKLSHDDTQALRGFLDGLDRCLAVPDTLRAEWENRKGRP